MSKAGQGPQATPRMFVGRGTQAVHETGVAQIGRTLGNHATNQTLSGPQRTPLYGAQVPQQGQGNAMTFTKPTVHRAGSQSATPAAREMPAGRDVMGKK